MSARPRPDRLAGQTVFLSASVPDAARDARFRQIADAPFQIEQAVISLARAVFSEGGRLVFGGHPSISPLVALVAGEYRQPLPADGGDQRAAPQVVIYQSEAFRDVMPADTDLLIRMGLAEEHWVLAADGERFVPGRGPAAEQCASSLLAMRQQMIAETEPVAMVCIGGMEGVLAEAEIFGRRGPVLALELTGGAAAILAEAGRATAMDREVMSELDRLRDAQAHDRRDDGGIAVLPFPLIMQTIVDGIAPPEDERHHG